MEENYYTRIEAGRLQDSGFFNAYSALHLLHQQEKEDLAVTPDPDFAQYDTSCAPSPDSWCITNGVQYSITNRDMFEP